MKTLKILSIVSLIGYPLYFFISVLLQPEAFIFVNVVYILYFVFYTVMCLLQGIKTKNTVLKIASIICCIVAAIIIFDIFTNAVITAIPFAIILSIIALVQSSKALRQK